MRDIFPLTPPERLFTRAEVLQRASPVPRAFGLYAWYFREVPAIVPTRGCLEFGGNTLLYLGIAPDIKNKPNSRSTLLKRIRQHYGGNAEGSTLRRTLGMLLEEKSGISAATRRKWQKDFYALTHAGEQYLDRWMEHNAFVAWIVHAEPWRIEHQLFYQMSCPLNISGNAHHPFYPVLRKMRADALQCARSLPIANEKNQHR